MSAFVRDGTEIARLNTIVKTFHDSVQGTQWKSI